MGDYDNMDDTDDINNVDNADFLEIFGISQNPDTKDYIMILQDGYCEKCGELHTNVPDELHAWCKPCLINDLKKNFTNWTSGNEKLDNFIQEMQLKINDWYDIIFEWIPYDQFNVNDLQIVGKGAFATVYSATWKDGRLIYDYDKKEWIREPDVKVALKFLRNLQTITDEFLNEV